MSKNFIVGIMSLTLLPALIIITTVLSQSAKQEREIPEPFECSTFAHANLKKEHVDKFDLDMDLPANHHTDLFHCRAGKLDCAYSNGHVSCVKTGLL